MTRARVGFHFQVRHKESRFGTTQDQIDERRSRTYPRRAQDSQFLAEARERLLKSFDGDAWRKNKRDHRFKCQHCGHQGNSDENAARVLAQVFWGEVNLPDKPQERA